jgi:thiamine biosynthesis protein ThiS
MEFPPLGAVLTTLGVRKELVAIALNDTIVPRDKWDQTFVSEEDKLEIVHFVGAAVFLTIKAIKTSVESAPKLS